MAGFAFWTAADFRTIVGTGNGVDRSGAPPGLRQTEAAYTGGDAGPKTAIWPVCVIEVEGPRGRLRVEWKSPDAPDLAALCRALWESGSRFRSPTNLHSGRGESIDARKDWRQANGALRDMVCRGLLLMLHRAGEIELPEVRFVARNPLAERERPAPVLIDTGDRARAGVEAAGDPAGPPHRR